MHCGNAVLVQYVMSYQLVPEQAAAPTGPSCSEKAEMCALHHRQRKEMQEVLAALQASYAETRAEAAASYRLMVGGGCANLGKGGWANWSREPLGLSICTSDGNAAPSMSKHVS